MKSRIQYILTMVFSWMLLLASYGQSSCENSDFSFGDFTNWTGYTSVYPKNTAGANIGNNVAYYYDEGIVPGRHTIINQSIPDPFTCGNVMTIAPGDSTSVRLGNGGIGAWGNGVRWQRDYLEYTVSVTDFNALLIYKYAVVLQDPNSDPGIAPHAAPIKPRFVVSIKDENDDLIDPVCGVYSVTADESVEGFRNCTQGDAEAAGGNFNSNGSTIYRAWTTVGVDLRQYVGTDVTLLFETWDCGLGGHFGYAYLSAKCDSMGIDAASCAANDGVTLTAPDGFSYVWSTGQTTQTIDIPNAVAGDTVRVVLTTTTGCSTDLYTVLNPARIRAEFTAAPTEICQNETISFNETSWSMFLLDSVEVPIVKRTWKFGDGTIDDTNTSSPTHVFTDFGEHTVTLVVENDFGCVDSIKHDITVRPFPVSNFTFEPNCENKTTDFESTALVIDGSISNWLWRFGNGDTSTNVNPSNVYSTSGDYNVELVVTSDFGCKDSTIKTVESWPSPVAIFSGGQSCSGDSMFFINNSTSLITDTIKSYLWDFGDLTSLSALKKPTHVYHSPGDFTVSLNIESDRGCIHDTTISVNVLQGPNVDFEFESVCLNTPVDFENKTTPMDSMASWEWVFGDGSTNFVDQDPTHTYVNSSFYTVQLIGTTTRGCVDSIQKTLQVAPNPIVNFKLEDVCLGEESEFNDQSIISSGFLSNWYWDFGDNVLSTDQNPIHEYIKDSTYNVKLVGESDLGCLDSVSKVINVRASPIPYFQADTVCKGDVTQFTNGSTGNGVDIMTYLWDFGDGSPLKDKLNPTYTYKVDSTFYANLKVTQNGCVKDTLIPVVVKPVPVVNIDFESVCLGVETQLESNVVSKSPIVNWDWYFIEDNSRQDTEDAIYLTGSANGFNVDLTVTAENGCTDDISEFLTVTPNPVVDFLTQSKCQGEIMRFTSLATVAQGFVQDWVWDFGDGNISTDKDPEHAFDTSGTILVSLKVTTSGNCIDSVSVPIEVWGQPVANFGVTEVCLGEVTDFTDSSTVGGGAIITSWVWNVGDGSLLKSIKDISHEYPGANTYNVELAIATLNGCTDTLVKTAKVHDVPVVDFSNPVVCFGEPTDFTNESENLNEFGTWSWDFGDGNNSVLENPSNLFLNTGDFLVELTGVDTNGCASVEAKNIVVKPLPTPIFDADNYSGCNPQCMNFSDYSIAPLDTIQLWEWDFGDGNTSKEQFPEHCFDVPGSYDVSLKVSTINGCENFLMWDSMITIYPVPIAGFTLGPQPTTELNSKITFTDESIGADSWRWDFGDKNVGTDQNPINDYYKWGDYKATQTVFTRFGCTDSISQWLRIEPEFKVYAANAFTPNSDGINDVFLPTGIGIDPDPDRYTFMVFDRWGNKIFETHDINEGWDGRVNTFEFLNTGKVQQIDVYVWKVIVYDITSAAEQHSIIGHVSLLK